MIDEERDRELYYEALRDQEGYEMGKAEDEYAQLVGELEDTKRELEGVKLQIGAMRQELQEQRGLWVLAGVTLNMDDDRRRQVRFMDLHTPIARITKVLGDSTEKRFQAKSTPYDTSGTRGDPETPA